MNRYRWMVLWLSACAAPALPMAAPCPRPSVAPPVATVTTVSPAPTLHHASCTQACVLRGRARRSATCAPVRASLLDNVTMDLRKSYVVSSWERPQFTYGCDALETPVRSALIVTGDERETKLYQIVRVDQHYDIARITTEPTFAHATLDRPSLDRAFERARVVINMSLSSVRLVAGDAPTASEGGGVVDLALEAIDERGHRIHTLHRGSSSLRDPAHVVAHVATAEILRLVETATFTRATASPEDARTFAQALALKDPNDTASLLPLMELAPRLASEDAVWSLLRVAYHPVFTHREMAVHALAMRALEKLTRLQSEEDVFARAEAICRGSAVDCAQE